MPKICPKCKREWPDEYMACPIDLTPLVSKPQQSAGFNLNLGDANAISGGVNMSDNHSVSNNTVNTTTSNVDSHNVITNNITQVEREKTPEELKHEKELTFREECLKVYSNGIMTSEGKRKLDDLRYRLGLDENTANKILSEVAKRSERKSSSLSPVHQITYNNIKTAIIANRLDLVGRLMAQLKAMVQRYSAEEIQFTYYMLKAVLYPKECTEEYESHYEDKYWQTFWSSIAYRRLGNIEKSELLVADVGDKWTDTIPQENVFVLATVNYLIDKDMDTAKSLFDNISGEHSPYLSNLTTCLYILLYGDTLSSEDLTQMQKDAVFYASNLFAEINSYNLEQKRLQAEAEAKRVTEEKKKLEEAEAKRIAEEKRQQAEAEAKRVTEEKKQQEKAEAKRTTEKKNSLKKNGENKCHAEKGLQQDASDLKDEMILNQDDEQVDKANSLLEEGKQKEAVAIYKDLAEKGNARAQGNYGNCLLNARGVKQNLKEGIVWLEKSANQDNEWACLRLAEAYLGWEYKGKSLQYDAERAKEYLSKALSLGADPEEVNHLALMTVPSVELSSIQINKNVKEKGVLGFEVVLKMVANAMVGRKLNFSAYCVPKNGDTSCLKKPGGRRVMNPATGCVTRSPQNCYYAEIIKPRLSSTVWEQFKFFIPYADILNRQAKWEETLVLIVWDQTNKKPELLACEEIPFSISCTTRMFRSNEWDFKLLKQGSAKKLVKIPPRKSPIVGPTQNAKEAKIEISKLPMDEIKKAANDSYPKESLKSLAIAALKIAEVIQERLPNADVSYMVHPSEFDPSVSPDALPVHFLFKKNGNPVVAVVAVTSCGYNATHVIETADACEKNGIGYVRVFADGFYADWIQGWKLKPLSKSPWFAKEPVSQETIDFCKDWLVDKISEYI